jgi:predicted Zn finger-like uncharacterized protein
MPFRKPIMRLLCPNCSTVYEVPDAALAGRSRKLQCAQCGTGWRSEPLSPDLAQSSDFAAAREAVGESRAPEPAGMQVADLEPASGAADEIDPIQGLPMFLTSGGDDDEAPPHQPGQGDSFADLVHAARNNAVEYEPEKHKPPPAVKISNLPLVLALVLALAAGLVGLAFLGHMT